MVEVAKWLIADNFKMYPLLRIYYTFNNNKLHPLIVNLCIFMVSQRKEKYIFYISLSKKFGHSCRIGILTLI